MDRLSQGDLPVNRSSVRASISAESKPNRAAQHAAERLRLANERLHQLRQQTGAKRQTARCAHSSTFNPSLPDHLGWQSHTFTTTLNSRKISQPAHETSLIHVQPSEDKSAECSNASNATLRIYPDLLNACLKQEQVAAGRVWLLCRHLDTQGRGWLTVETLREQLTNKQSSLRVCGYRRLRQILQAGSETFWQRDGAGRLWLFGVARVAAHLAVERLGGQPILLPIDGLIGGIQTVRAHFFAAFHGGRKRAAPISRAALTEVTGVSERAQRMYDRMLNVERVTNYAVGVGGANSAETTHYQHGNSVFNFHDRQGTFGRAGQTYLARQLPNQYKGVHQQAANGRQKKINRKLKDLVNKLAQGNRGKRLIGQLYYREAQAAVLAYSQAHQPRYWCDSACTKGHQLWHSLI